MTNRHGFPSPRLDIRDLFIVCFPSSMLSNLPNPKFDRTSAPKSSAPRSGSPWRHSQTAHVSCPSGAKSTFTRRPSSSVLDDTTRAGDWDVLVEFAREASSTRPAYVLIQAAQRLQAAGRSLRVTSREPHTHGVIETMGLGGKLGLMSSSASEPEPRASEMGDDIST